MPITVNEPHLLTIAFAPGGLVRAAQMQMIQRTYDDGDEGGKVRAEAPGELHPVKVPGTALETGRPDLALDLALALGDEALAGIWEQMKAADEAKSRQQPMGLMSGVQADAILVDEHGYPQKVAPWWKFWA